MKNQTIPQEYEPSPSEVEKYIRLWNSLDNYVNQEKALDKLFFSLCQKNDTIEDVLLKCSTLNDFYSTNIFELPTSKLEKKRSSIFSTHLHQNIAATINH